MRNPAALFSSRQRRMSTVKIGSGCLVWVDSVEKVSKGWNSGSELKPLSSLVGDSEEWLVRPERSVGSVPGRHQAFLWPGFCALQLNDGSRWAVTENGFADRVWAAFRAQLWQHLGELLGLCRSSKRRHG